MTDTVERPAIDRLARPAVKLYGERNSGTGYLRALLLRNLDVECLVGGLPRRLQRLFPRSERLRDAYFRVTARHNLGWKHAAAPTREQLSGSPWGRHANRLIFLTLTKNPYAWLLSLHRRPYHARRRFDRFEDFLRAPWPTVGRENGPDVYENPISMWNRKNAGYLGLADYARAQAWRYEDLIRDPERYMTKLQDDLACRARGDAFRNVSEATKGGDRGRTFDDYRAYYLEERWRQDLAPDDIRIINDGLDPDLVERFGYSIIPS